ncbi:MAG TPA: methylated-DNA--[protein]-cysteine S-methyltransferase [Polyangiaceae bacterium]|nr:methylated-DNA--[protein]-cysteine S-methyltransferase [Polyangiaceae bacterium]
MKTPGFALFESKIGRCGIAWANGGVVALALPEARDAATRARLLARCPEATEQPPPRPVARVIKNVERLLCGDRVSFDDLILQMEGLPAFHRRVYETVRAIPPGTTLSYGEVAARLGSPGSARAVGQALGKNPFPIVVPCHRVLAAGGKLGGFTANGGLDTKTRMLTLEGVRVGSAAAARRASGSSAFAFDAEQALSHLSSRDARLARAIRTAGPFRLQIKKTHSVFEALAEAIVYQQLTGKAAATIFGRVREVCSSGRKLTPADVARTPAAKLRGAGLSQAKMLALQDLAQKTLARQLPTLAQLQKMDDADIVTSLTSVRGIGEWTVHMLLIFRLGRPDVLPTGDYGVRKGFQQVFGTPELPSAKELEARAAGWSPYRSVASWYLWRVLDGAP